ncbi:hypothetical protein MPSEU_000538100 [Mayamaea pseudoterrestris]|nr:hypothetical protein MPSEU_000537700 [Mayamaea pseudoterrestris]GKY95774.1 hypothetical protein MPSEU_000538100 [Mayamaea pseudoterrestris]
MMMKSFTLLVALQNIFCSTATASSDGADAVYRPPLFTLSDLRNGHRLDELRSVMSTTGLLQVSLEESDVSSAGLEVLCQCSSVLSKVPGVDSVTLADDSTRRTSLGTATVGSRPLPLPEELSNVCGSDAVISMEAIRDEVALAADVFQAAWDGLLQSDSSSFRKSMPLLKNKNGIVYESMQQISQASTHLEHFHLYAKLGEQHEQEEPAFALDWHTDAGLFLAFVPAHSCDVDGPEDDSFYIMDTFDNHRKNVKFHPNAVAIMLGTGAEHWLNNTVLRHKAARHAVQMRPGQSRAWYGMMHLVPDGAIIQSSPEQTFGDMKQSMRYNKDRGYLESEGVSIGCGSESVEPLDAAIQSLESSSIQSTDRRRLQHVQNADACNNSTNFFCWMQCLEVPDFKQAEGYLREGYSLYCLDPATLAASSNRVSAAVEPCQDGYVHNAYCTGSWQPTAPGVTAIPVATNASSPSLTNEQWCYGATSMYMDGFHWRNSVCVIYLFPQWILSTPGKVVGASIGTLAFGVGLEKTIHHRRLVVTSMKAGYYRLAASAFLYAFQLTMGYLLMLIIMTYSGPLFLCVILGLVGGHVLFNAKDALLVPKGDVCAARECAEECPQDCRTEDSEIVKGCPCEQIEENQRAGVPEGITPCCQNTL